jgi:DNA-binding MarR family transcriptional regulator
VSRVVDELSGEGLVERQPHPVDARSAFAVLTEKGMERFRSAAPLYLAAIQQEFADGLNDRELAVLAEALGRVRDRVNHR